MTRIYLYFVKEMHSLLDVSLGKAVCISYLTVRTSSLKWSQWESLISCLFSVFLALQLASVWSWPNCFSVFVQVLSVSSNVVN